MRSPQLSRAWIDEWLLGKLLARTLQDLGLDDGAASWAVGTIKILTSHQRRLSTEAEGRGAGAETERTYHVLVSWLRDQEIQRFLQVNRYRGELWFNHEAFEKMLSWMLAIATVEIGAEPGLDPAHAASRLAACYDVVERLVEAESVAGYRVVGLLEAAKEEKR